MENLSNRGESGLDLMIENSEVSTKEGEGGLIKESAIQSAQVQSVDSVTDILDSVGEKREKKKLKKDYDSSLAQLNSQEFMMDNETYVRLQQRHIPSLEIMKSLSDVRNPPARQLIQKFPLFYFDKTFKGHEKPFFEDHTIEKKVFKNIYGR